MERTMPTPKERKALRKLGWTNLHKAEVSHPDAPPRDAVLSLDIENPDSVSWVVDLEGNR